MLGYGESYGARQLVAIALNEIVKSLARIQMRVQLLGLCGIERRGGCVPLS